MYITKPIVNARFQERGAPKPLCATCRHPVHQPARSYRCTITGTMRVCRQAHRQDIYDWLDPEYRL